MKKRISGLFFLLLALGFILSSDEIRSEPLTNSEETRENGERELAFPETFLTFSARSFNSFIYDMRAIGAAASNPAFSAMIEGPLRFWAGADVMKKADLDRQMGLVFQGRPETSEILSFFYVPIDDIGVLKNFLTKNNMEFEIRDDKTYAWNQYFLTVKDGWTFGCQSEEQLELIRRSPIEELIDIMEDETFRVTLEYAKIPERFREIFRTSIEEGCEVGLILGANESAEDFEEREETAREQIEYLMKIWDSFDKFVWTARVDSESQAVCFMMKTGLKSGSFLAETLKKVENTSSVFSGFIEIPGLFRGYGVSITDDVGKNIQKKQQEEIWGELEKFWGLENDFKSRKLFDEILLLCRRILEESSARTENHSGCFFDGVPGNMDLICAFQFEDPSKAREAAEKITEIVREKLGGKFDESWVKKDVLTNNGMKFFQITVPTSAIIDLAELAMNDEMKNSKNERELLFRIVGDSLTFAVGGKDGVCFAAIGNDPLSKIEEIPEKQSEMKFGEVRIDFRKLLQFILSLDKFYVAAFESELETSESKLTVNSEEKQEAYATGSEENFNSELDKSICELGNWERTNQEESIKQAKKMQRTLELLLAIMDESENVDAAITTEIVPDGFRVRIELEEGITRILGMLPSMLLFNAM